MPRMQVDLMFAALVTLAVVAVTLFFSVDALLRRALPWQPDTSQPTTEESMRKILLATLLVFAVSPARAADKLTVILEWFVNPTMRDDRGQGEGILRRRRARRRTGAAG